FLALFFSVYSTCLSLSSNSLQNFGINKEIVLTAGAALVCLPFNYIAVITSGCNGARLEKR
ncbi:MAG: hypothetical protein M3142_03350, partial [Bacteroidota bacterium]|nr:hypothetical protein [Bacteroidota bacterium]